MLKKFKDLMASEKGMSIVNVVFILSILIRNRGIIMVAFALWMVYLGYCWKRTQRRSMKIISGVFFVFAAVMLVLNLVGYIMYGK